MVRLAVALALFALVVPAAPAAAQSSPFSPLPVAPPQAATPTPAPTATPTSVGNQETGTRTLYVIGIGLLVAFAAIGVWIARDARSSIPEHRRGRHAMAEPAPGEPRDRRRDPQAKARARQRGKAQRAARRQNRPR
jgi:hypothetical protein